jgi:hypothetical protein
MNFGSERALPNIASVPEALLSFRLCLALGGKVCSAEFSGKKKTSGGSRLRIWADPHTCPAFKKEENQ